MAVHRSGALAPVAGDLQTTHQGVQIALKVINWGMGGSPFLGLIERKGTTWEVISVVDEFDDRSDGKAGYRFQAEAEVAGSILNWIKQVLIPKINAALAARFKATGAPAPAPAPTTTGDPFVDLDNLLIATLRWAPQADGTLKVVA